MDIFCHRQVTYVWPTLVSVRVTRLCVFQTIFHETGGSPAGRPGQTKLVSFNFVSTFWASRCSITQQSIYMLQEWFVNKSTACIMSGYVIILILFLCLFYHGNGNWVFCSGGFHAKTAWFSGTLAQCLSYKQAVFARSRTENSVVMVDIEAKSKKHA